MILPDTPATGATEIAERIRAAIDGLAIEHAESEFGRVTASIGVASWDPGQEGEVESVIKAADEALYHAKETGETRWPRMKRAPDTTAGTHRPPPTAGVPFDAQCRPLPR